MPAMGDALAHNVMMSSRFGENWFQVKVSSPPPTKDITAAHVVEAAVSVAHRKSGFLSVAT